MLIQRNENLNSVLQIILAVIGIPQLLPSQCISEHVINSANVFNRKENVMHVCLPQKEQALSRAIRKFSNLGYHLGYCFTARLKKKMSKAYHRIKHIKVASQVVFHRRASHPKQRTVNLERCRRC